MTSISTAAVVLVGTQLTCVGRRVFAGTDCQHFGIHPVFVGHWSPVLVIAPGLLAHMTEMQFNIDQGKAKRMACHLKTEEKQVFQHKASSEEANMQQ